MVPLVEREKATLEGGRKEQLFTKKYGLASNLALAQVAAAIVFGLGYAS